ncbi:hypothetical protein [Streptomyces ipomoeae]|nr:hypothetical protein [Streptomyces ipomoeae]
MRPDTPAENVDHTSEAARLERTARSCRRPQTTDERPQPAVGVGCGV